MEEKRARAGPQRRRASAMDEENDKETKKNTTEITDYESVFEPFIEQNDSSSSDENVTRF